MAFGQFQKDICLWVVNQDTKDSRVTTICTRDSSPNWSLERWVPKGSTPAHMEGPLPCNTFHSYSSRGTRTCSWIHYSRVKPWKETEEDTPYTCEPLGDLRYLFRLQMSAILINIPKIKFLGIRFLRTALKSQHSLAGVVLQNRQEIDFLIPEQGGTWTILNEMCCFWVNTSS